MPRLYLILLIIFISMTDLAGQDVDFFFSSGIGTYSMENLNSINRDIQQQVPFETSIVTDFPPWFQFGGQVTVRAFSMYRIGVKYMFCTTGSRVSSSDYSGKYYFDDIAIGHTVGLVNSFRVFGQNAWQIDLQLNFGAIFSSVKLEESLTVFDTVVTGNSRYTSGGLFLEPLFQGTYQWKMLKMGLFAGYLFNKEGILKTSGGGSTNAVIDWSGFRFGILIGLTTGKLPQPVIVNSR